MSQMMQKLVEVGFQERKVVPFVKAKASEHLEVDQIITCKISGIDEHRGIYCNHRIQTENGSVAISGLISRRNLLEKDNKALDEMYAYAQEILVKVQNFDSKGNAAFVEVKTNGTTLNEKIIELQKEKEEMEKEMLEMQQKMIHMQMEMQENTQKEVIQQLTHKIEKITGKLSPNAERKLRELVENHDVLDLGASFNRVAANFDPSNLFIKQLDGDIGRCLRGY